MEKNKVSMKLKMVSDYLETFVENNLIEKSQREEGIKKLSAALDSLVKTSNLKNFYDQVARPQVKLRLKKLAHFKGELPRFQTPGSSGMDVRAQLDQPLVIEPGARALVPTGLSMAVPEGFEIQARPRSGYAIREGMTLLNTPGTIDADYRGEVKIILINLGAEPVTVNDQDRIAQLCVAQVPKVEVIEVENLDATSRGDGGFGSTGKL